MTLGEYLKNKFGYNEPIFCNDIMFKNYSRPWIFKEIKKLIESGEMKRFDKGIYYFPTKMFFGDSFLDPRKVVERRFLSYGNDVYGYIAGISLLSLTGLSSQVPMLIELASNNETTRIRDLKVGTQRVRARRSRVTVTKDNVAALQFLDLMNSISPAAMDETAHHMLCKYIKDAGITRNAVMRYTGLFPAKTIKNMFECGVVYELT